MATIKNVTLGVTIRGNVPEATDLRFYAVAECELVLEPWEVRMMSAPGPMCFQMTGEIFSQELHFERPKITPITHLVINDHEYKLPTEEKVWSGIGVTKVVSVGEFTPVELPNPTSPPATNMVVPLTAWVLMHHHRPNAVIWAEITLQSTPIMPMPTNVTAHSNNVQLP